MVAIIVLRLEGVDGARLAATEIVRRCERRVGELVKRGQGKGMIRKQGASRAGTTNMGTPMVSTSEIFDGGQTTRTEHYALAEPSPDDFNAAIEEAKSEGNLSRANVVRKVKGDSKTDPLGVPFRHDEISDYVQGESEGSALQRCPYCT